MCDQAQGAATAPFFPFITLPSDHLSKVLRCLLSFVCLFFLKFSI